jgi:hypothetical protein
MTAGEIFWSIVAILTTWVVFGSLTYLLVEKIRMPEWRDKKGLTWNQADYLGGFMSIFWPISLPFYGIRAVVLFLMESFRLLKQVIKK